MLGKLLKNFQQVGIYYQLCKSGKGCRCRSASADDIKSHVAGWYKSFLNSSATYNTKVKAKPETERSENDDLTHPRSNISGDLLVISSGSKGENTCGLNINFYDTLNFQPLRDCLSSKKLFSLCPKNSKHTHLNQAIANYRINEYGKGIFALKHHNTINLLISKELFQELRGCHLCTRSFHVLSNDVSNYFLKSLPNKLECKSSSSAEPVKNVVHSVAKLSGKGEANPGPTHVKSQERKNDVIAPPNGSKVSSSGPQRQTRYFHAFHPSNVGARNFREKAAGKREKIGAQSTSREKGKQKKSATRFSAVRSIDVLKPDHHIDSESKISLTTKSPFALDGRNCYSTCCDDENRARLLAERQLHASTRGMSSSEDPKAPQKGDPVTSTVAMEMKAKKPKKAKKAKKGKAPPKKAAAAGAKKPDKEKSPKKKKKPKVVCGSEQSSTISCLDVCHTRVSCGLKKKKKGKSKPQKCLVMGCKGGLSGLIFKLTNMFKKDRKCKFKKMKK